MDNLDTTFDNKRIAMLIDGENAQSSLIDKMVAETGKYGLVTVRRIYGDWTTPQMKSWKDVLNDHAIQPIQQFRYTIGKNSSDSSLIIDAMDILYEGTVHGFCLASSDSDYTRLATRIREKGLFVMGIGRKNTPPAFVKACQVFVYTENLMPEKQIVKFVPHHEQVVSGIIPVAAAGNVTSDPLPLAEKRLRPGGAGGRLGIPGDTGRTSASARPRLRFPHLRLQSAFAAGQSAKGHLRD
jgi:uncharacterized LabA/DUF88 family protein